MICLIQTCWDVGPLLAPHSNASILSSQLAVLQAERETLNLVKWIHLLREVHFDVGQRANEQRQMIS